MPTNEGDLLPTPPQRAKATERNQKLPTKLFRLALKDGSPASQAMFFREHYADYATRIGVHVVELKMPTQASFVPSDEGIVEVARKSLKKNMLVLVLCMSGMRCMDVYRQLRKDLDVQVLKLFAKHLKISEQEEMLAQHRHRVAVGTPDRIHSLMERGSLKIEQINLLVLDCAYTDAQRRTLLNTNDTRNAFFALFRKSLHDLGSICLLSQNEANKN